MFIQIKSFNKTYVFNEVDGQTQKIIGQVVSHGEVNSKLNTPNSNRTLLSLP